MSRPSENQEIDLQIAEVISRWMETSTENRPAVGELIAQHPELAPGLAECLAGFQRIEQGKASVAQDATLSMDIPKDDVVFPVIPDFEVLGELGRGGMGVVYEARQLSLDRIVALKVLPFAVVDPQSVKRFLREAETVAALAHSGIVPIYALGVHNGLNWFAMQRIDGCPLSQWFAVATFDSRAAMLSEVVRIGIEAAEALQHAHERGVIHRDVKPGNLLVDTTGKVWLTDFGLARRDVDVTATVTGAMLGTPRYMSAEQIADCEERIDARTDIYSLGATLYEMATGRPPFTSESTLGLLTQIRCDEPTPPRQIDRNIPRTLELVLLKCLDKEPHRRYPSAAALADDLKAIRDDKPILAKGLPAWIVASRFLKRHQRQVQAAALTLFGTVATLLSVALLWQQSEQAKYGQVRIDTPAALYVANIQPRIDKALSDSRESESANVRHEVPDSSVVTTPMQKPMSLPVGEYRVRLEGTGSRSQTVDIVVNPKASTEIEYVDRRESLSQVDIHQKLSLSMRDSSLAVLGKDSFEVFDPDVEKKPRFALPIAELDAGLAEVAPDTKRDTATDDDPPLTFAFNANQAFQGDYTVTKSGFARIERIGNAQVDFDSDGQSDFLITAARHAAIAAVSGNGAVLWKRHLPMTFEIAKARSGLPKQGMANEAIVGIIPVDDVDNDGITDLVVNAALFDPSGFSRPYIFTLSGRDGKDISVAPLPTIAMDGMRTWPWSGLLKHRREWNVDDRKRRHIQSHFNNITMRTRTADLYNDSWSGIVVNSALYVLPPLILGFENDVRFAVTADNQSVHFINLADGTAVSPSIKFSQSILRGPQRVQLPDGKLGVLVLTGNPGTSMSSWSLELCAFGESQPRWSIPQYLGAFDLVAGAADSSFPMVIDLDKDGNEEIILPTNPDVPFKWPQLQCYSTSGKLQWTSHGVASLSTVIDQALPLGDIDRDGVIDLALVGLQDLSAAQVVASQTGSVSREGLRLIIDFISGKSGKRIGYREEYLAASVKNRDVAEIDYVEFTGHELVCSVVYGSNEELKLSSMSITIDLTQFNASTVARGLTMLPRGELQSNGRGNWYRRRSGPHANPSDMAVWVAREYKENIYPGEKLVASWNSPKKESRLLLMGADGTVRCVNPIDGENVWTSERLFLDPNNVLVLERSDGRSDLVFTNSNSNSNRSNAKPGFYDSETGKIRFEIDFPAMYAIQSVTFDNKDSDRIVYAIAGSHTVYSFQSPKRDQGYLLTKVDRHAGRLLWSRECYQGQNAKNGSFRPADPIQTDVNGDQVTDLITGNSDNGRLVIEAIDGRDGQPLWRFPLQLTLANWPWGTTLPMMKLITSGNQQYLLAVDGVQQDDRLFDLKSIQIHDVRELDKLRRKTRAGLRHEVASQNLSLFAMAPEKRDGIVALVTAYPDDDLLVNSMKGSRAGRSFGIKMLHVDELTGQIQALKSGEDPYATVALTDKPAVGSLSSIYTADIDNDQILDQIEYRASGQILVRATNSQANTQSDISVTDGKVHNLEQIANKWYLKVTNKHGNYVWYELPSGKPALQYDQGLESIEIGERRYPRLHAHRTGTLLVGSTPEATVCVQVELDTAKSSSLQPTAIQLGSLSVAMISPEMDPRYRKAIVVHGMFERKTFADIIRIAFLALGAFLLPVFFVLRLLRRRQWSMQEMLIAPVLVMVAIVCWRALGSSQPGHFVIDAIAGSMVALSVWSVFTLMRHGKWKMLGGSIALCMVVATLLMFGAQASIPRSSPGMIGYWTWNGWLTSVCTVAPQIVWPLTAGAVSSRAQFRKAGSVS